MVTTVENNNIDISCVVSTVGGVRPNPVWLKTQLSTNNSFLVLTSTGRVNIVTQEDTHSIETNTGKQCNITTVRSRLTIQNTEPGDGATYICQADGVDIKNVTVNVTGKNLLFNR